MAPLPLGEGWPVTSVKQLGGNSMVTSATEIVDAAGEHVVTAVSALVVRAEDEA